MLYSLSASLVQHLLELDPSTELVLFPHIFNIKSVITLH